MEEREKICQCWTTDDLVAIFERKDFSSGESVEPSKFECIKHKIITRFLVIDPCKKWFAITGNSGSEC